MQNNLTILFIKISILVNTSKCCKLRKVVKYIFVLLYMGLIECKVTSFYYLK